MTTSSYDSLFINELLSETEDTKREHIINQLQTHLFELESNNQYVDELSQKFMKLQNEFKRLAVSKKQIEWELNNKICLLQQANEELSYKYVSAQKQIQILMDSIGQQERNVNSKGRNCFSNGNNDYENTVGFYQQQIEDANNTIIRLNNVIKTLEDKNQVLIDKCFVRVEKNNEKEVIIGLKRVIDDKEKMINSLYRDYAQLNIKYEDAIKQRDVFKNELESVKKDTVKSCYNCGNVKDRV